MTLGAPGAALGGPFAIRGGFSFALGGPGASLRGGPGMGGGVPPFWRGGADGRGQICSELRRCKDSPELYLDARHP